MFESKSKSTADLFDCHYNTLNPKIPHGWWFGIFTPPPQQLLLFTLLNLQTFQPFTPTTSTSSGDLINKCHIFYRWQRKNEWLLRKEVNHLSPAACSLPACPRDSLTCLFNRADMCHWLMLKQTNKTNKQKWLHGQSNVHGLMCDSWPVLANKRCVKFPSRHQRVTGLIESSVVRWIHQEAWGVSSSDAEQLAGL